VRQFKANEAPPIAPFLTTPAQAKAECNRIAEGLPLHWDKKHAVATKKSLHGIGEDIAQWTVTSGKSMFVVDDKTGEVVEFSDLSIPTYAPFTPADFRHQPERLWKIGDKVRDRIGSVDLVHWRIDFGDMRKKSDSTERAVLHYQVKPHGFDSNGMGNFLVVTVDKIDYSIVHFAIRSGWTYDDANIVISEATAIKIAGQLCNEPTSNAFANLSYVEPNEAFGSVKGPVFQNQKHSRLSYRVFFAVHGVYVDAETGECLGGVKITSMPAAPQREVGESRGRQFSTFLEKD
jgi:hypothetical protein